MPNDEWHDRSAEMRALAERMSNSNTKRTILKLAEDYEKFSDRAAERAGSRRAWVSPSIRLIRAPSDNLLSAIARRRPKPSRPAEKHGRLENTVCLTRRQRAQHPSKSSWLRRAASPA